MHILVVGGAGYVGSVTVDQLINGGHDVTVLDNVVAGHRGALNPSAEFVQADVRGEEGLNRLFPAHNPLPYASAAGAPERLGEDHRPETHLIPNVLQVALGQRPAISLYGDDYSTRDGTCVRDYIHVSDLAAAHLLALDRTDTESAAYNLGSGLGFTNREVIESAPTLTPEPIPVHEERS